MRSGFLRASFSLRRELSSALDFRIAFAFSALRAAWAGLMDFSLGMVGGICGWY